MLWGEQTMKSHQDGERKRKSHPHRRRLRDRPGWLMAGPLAESEHYRGPCHPCRERGGSTGVKSHRRPAERVTVATAAGPQQPLLVRPRCDAAFAFRHGAILATIERAYRRGKVCLTCPLQLLAA